MTHTNTARRNHEPTLSTLIEERSRADGGQLRWSTLPSPADFLTAAEQLREYRQPELKRQHIQLFHEVIGEMCPRELTQLEDCLLDSRYHAIEVTKNRTNVAVLTEVLRDIRAAKEGQIHHNEFIGNLSEVFAPPSSLRSDDSVPAGPAHRARP